MARSRVLLVFLAVATVALGGSVAESEGLHGSATAEATFLPAFSTGVWLDLDWGLDGWSVGSQLEVLAFPGFGIGWTGTAGYSFSIVDLGATIGVDVYPFAFAGFELSADVALFDVASGEFTASADASLLSEFYPAFANTLSLGVDAAYGILTLWTDLDLAVPGFTVSLEVGGEVGVLDLDLDSARLTAHLGASTFVVPAVDAQLWFDVALQRGSVTLTAETDFDLTPFGLVEQRFEVEIGFDGLTIYAWGSYTGARVLSAGIGITWDFL